ncbi:MAG TPA: formate--tetrahydrofolate ligase [Candidatus Thioglobus sp.]|jgi:formate--tetrahydrofolate ligase|nr:formate--tetrahydrofolate ligase [Candidatus Thioglobus sp.]HIL43190.1 formate--tetrahydrofolate ligase [Gammaproteobacteria bacterium]
MSSYKTDIEIAREATGEHINDIGAKLNINQENLVPFGHDKAKISWEAINNVQGNKDGRLILVTAVTPTPAGEGKTTTSVGLTDGLNKIGKQTTVCLREPSLGPCFGMKGGAAGGGYAQVIPMEDINLHFTGDFHAITSAHSLLNAMIDNHIYWGNELNIDTRKVQFRRVVDMNDRSLRSITSSLGGSTNGYPREDGYDITVASEVMAIFCLSQNLTELEERLGNIIVAYTRHTKPIRAKDINAHHAMTVLLKDAFRPNLVQTLEGNPALIHGGPFANIAHGCNSVIATKTALKLSDYVVTEAGFGADLGAEKFFNIKCRKAGLVPDAVVLVATIRALKHQGGVAKDNLNNKNIDALVDGCVNLGRHIRNLSNFGVPIVVAINKFVTDTEAEFEAVKDYCAQFNVDVSVTSHWEHGGDGALDLAEKVAKLADSGTSQFKTLYDDDLSLFAKVETIAKTIYQATEVQADQKIRDSFAWYQDNDFGHLPVCIAKTQYSFSTDPLLLGAPSNHSMSIREVRLSAGAEFIVVVCGAIMTMPGLPRTPAADKIKLNKEGLIEGLF